MSSSLSRIEPFYVVDTNALIWHLTTDRKLGKRAAQVFAAAQRGETRLLVSALAVAELYYADKKHRLFANFDEVFQRLRSSPYIRFMAFEAEHVLDFDIDAKVPEMHDRIMTGLARRLGAPLLTSDPKIIAANLAVIVWD
jgi:PIN domain nuclease of toxin-antitoxin system